MTPQPEDCALAVEPPGALLDVAPPLDPLGGVAMPIRLVDLGTAVPGELAEAAARAVPSVTGVVVGISREGTPHPSLAPLVRALDLTLADAPTGRETVTVPDVQAAARALVGTVSAFPQAATVLAGLLRWSGDLPVAAALDAESLAYSTLLGGPEFAGWLARRGDRPPPPDVADPVLVERVDDELRITLNRPERRNAYGRQLRDALIDALLVAELDDTVAGVVLDGAGPSFCSGGDLDEFGTTPDPVTAHLVRTRAGAALPLDRLGGRVHARLHGVCVGAGIELPAYAGRLTAAPDARFVLPEVAMGLIPGAGGTVSIPRRIGRWRTLWLALTGAPLDASTALEWGLVDEIDPIAG
jgi:enoyl-CoA hydratase/carnithine racemase